MVGLFALLSLASGFSLQSPVLFGTMTLLTLVSAAFLWRGYSCEAQVPTGTVDGLIEGIRASTGEQTDIEKLLPYG